MMLLWYSDSHGRHRTPVNSREIKHLVSFKFFNSFLLVIVLVVYFSLFHLEFLLARFRFRENIDVNW